MMRYLVVLLFVPLLLGVISPSVDVPIMLTPAGGDPTVGLLPSYNDAWPNWKNAGLALVGGVSTVEASYTQCGSTVTPSGLIPPTLGDDASRINAAIAACSAGQYVLLNGAFLIDLSERGITIPSGVVLRGSGTCNNAPMTFPQTAPHNTGICPTSIAIYNGQLPFTVFSGNTACGVDTSHAGACPNGGSPVIFLGPSSGIPGWSNCGPQSGNATGLSCNGVALAADAAQGATSVQLTSTSAFSVGQYVLIDEDTAAQWTAVSASGYDGWTNVYASPEYLNSSGSPSVARLAWSKYANSGLTTFGGDLGNTAPGTSGSSGCFFNFCGRPTAEIHKISAIGSSCPGTGCTLTFDDPLMIGYRQSGGHNAQVYWPSLSTDGGGTYHAVTSNMSQNSGLENISILRGPSTGVLMRFCVDCWITGTEVAEWEGGGIQVQDSIRDEISNTLIQLCQWCTNNGGEYSFDMSEAATEILLTNSITQYGGKGMVGRAGGAGSVISYNDLDKTHYWAGISETWVEMSANASHYIGPHHVLFEGNFAVDLDNDNTHGSSNYLTYYRNLGQGVRSRFTDPATGDTVDDAHNLPGGNGPFRAAGMMGTDYWMSFIGNVLGESGVTDAAHGWTFSSTCGWCDFSIFLLGWNTGSLGGGPGPGGGADPYLNGVNGSYYFTNGNYDYYNNAPTGQISWNGGTPLTLTNSFYTPSEPSFFLPATGCTYTWPWVTPAGSSPVLTNSCGLSGLPAKARADANTPFVNPSPGSVTAVALNGGTTGHYSSGAANGTSVGPITVTLSNGGMFDGVLSLTGTAAADFSVSGSSNLITNGSTPTCSSTTNLNLNIVATPGSGEVGSPFTQAVTVTCNPLVASTWDPSHTDANLTLSVGNTVATNNGGGSGNATTFSTQTQNSTTSKSYFEVQCTQTGTNNGIGMQDNNTSGSFLGNNGHSFGYYRTNLVLNNSNGGGWDGCATGDTVGILDDETVSPPQVYIRVYHSGAWNAKWNATTESQPTSGGYTMASSMTQGQAKYVAGSPEDTSDADTICTHSSCGVSPSGLPTGAVWFDGF